MRDDTTSTPPPRHLETSRVDCVERDPEARRLAFTHTTTDSRGGPPRGRLRRGPSNGPLMQRPAVRRRAIRWPNLKVGVEDRPLPRIDPERLRSKSPINKIQTQTVHEAPPMVRRTPRSRPARVAAALRGEQHDVARFSTRLRQTGREGDDRVVPRVENERWGFYVGQPLETRSIPAPGRGHVVIITSFTVNGRVAV